MINSKKKIGEKIKKSRMRHGYTQRDLAEKVGLTEKQISKIETGVHYPKFENFVRILEALEITMKDFDKDVEMTTPDGNSDFKKIIKMLYNADALELKYFLSVLKLVDKVKNKYKRNK